MNKVILIGRLVRDPELKQTPSGTPVLQNTIAVTRKFKNQQGEYESDFINFVALNISSFVATIPVPLEEIAQTGS